ncbi:MAG: hypothetical protein JWP11_1293 [Frankiales bacterium]|nr:hypothetical protein [Frankiales bacterium]
MTFSAVELRGSQLARVRSVPAYGYSSGTEAIELCEANGVHLDPWQQHCLLDSLGEAPNGKWTSFEVGLVVSRQNGKGEILMARELAGLFLFGERLIVHTAHEFKTAAEAFLRIKSVVKNSPELMAQVKAIREANGEQGIELHNGARLRFLARSKGSGRGFSGDLIILDEAYELGPAAMAALMPTMAARPNPQIWYASSAGMVDSEQLNAVRVRGIAGDAKSLAYLEYSAEPGECDDDKCDHHFSRTGCWMDDRQAWADANPALGYRLTEDFIEKERQALPAEEFARERLSVWSDSRTEAVIPMDDWEACIDEDSKATGRVVPALDIPPDRSMASIAIAGLRTDGRTHLEVALREPGTSWVVERMVEFQRKHRSHPLMLDPAGPAGSLITDLERAGVRLTLVSTREYGQACGALYDAVKTKRIAHRGNQQPLTDALLAARKRTLGDAWAWDRKDNTDISPLVAITLAKKGLDAIGGGALGLIL